MQAWFERWNIKINEYKTQAIYFSRGIKPVESHLPLKGRNIPSVNNVKYLGVNFDKKNYMETSHRKDRRPLEHL
jgi:hypothetical protein